MGFLTEEAFTEFLDFDGILFMRLAEVNSGVLATEDVFRRLWHCLNHMHDNSKVKNSTTIDSHIVFRAEESNETDDENQVELILNTSIIAQGHI